MFSEKTYDYSSYLHIIPSTIPLTLNSPLSQKLSKYICLIWKSKMFVEPSLMSILKLAIFFPLKFPQAVSFYSVSKKDDFLYPCPDCWDLNSHTMKTTFTFSLVVANPDVTFSVKTDVSFLAIDIVLLQADTNDNLRPCSYFSCTFALAEYNYNIYDCKLLAVILAFTKWCQYVQGTFHPVTIIMCYMFPLLSISRIPLPLILLFFVL